MIYITIIITTTTTITLNIQHSKQIKENERDSSFSMHNIQEKRTAYPSFLSANPKAGNRIENLGTDEMTILIYIFKNKVYMCGLKRQRTEGMDRPL
jgi:hypothetical protein